jgi:probable rRNA maturation factor
LKIRIFYEGLSYRIKGWKKIRDLIVKVIAKEGNFSGDLNLVLAGDEFILDINRKFLKHNWNTDVITFNYGNDSEPAGEIYISLDTVRVNSLNYKVSYRIELLRVIIHGVLHICGYEDSDSELKEKMRVRENYWMDKLERN